MRELKPAHDASHPIQSPCRFPIQYQLGENGRAEQFAVLRNDIEIRDVSVPIVPRPWIQLSAGDGPLPQHPHGRIQLRGFTNRPAKRHYVDLGWEEDEPELDHAPPPLLSRDLIIHHHFIDGITRVEQKRARIFLYDLGRIPRHTADAVGDNEGFGRLVKECRLAVRANRSKFKWSERLVVDIHHPFWYRRLLRPILVPPFWY
mmetsp:Transcript_54083/g.114873  ORF Transcript_54083/g.114873 Transcript_54083/m.114873 type:complete len:203 (+) Transcript_54083:285-893(+)